MDLERVINGSPRHLITTCYYFIDWVFERIP
ncbi:hypothetical protein Goari_025418 [Gossypium aridum]|uniref:Uncharacterized protein n=1 Tax=Gossypium aridum TaxID=34290 RepID=A0A7J8XAH6_GOSAI|nr:hypothetical protein [Gossypium aridum]